MAIISDAPLNERAVYFVTLVFLVAFSFILFRVWYSVLEKCYQKIVPKKLEHKIWPLFIWAVLLSVLFLGVSLLFGILPF